MIDKRIITPEELEEYGSVVTLNDQAETLIKHQRVNWPMAGENHAALSSVLVKTFDFNHFKIEVHYNPKRIRSSAARTDAESIARRPCFLCAHNLPPEQKGIPFDNNYIILANPFPIFPVHLTITHRQHIPQQLEAHIDDMLYLCRQLTNFSVFYNGPQCGASAPDHFHFQAVKKGYLPIESEIDFVKRLILTGIYKINNLEIIAAENYLRRFVAVISDDKDKILDAFDGIYNLLKVNANEEPMMNVIGFYEEGKWNLVVFPRAKQRPSHFFKVGNEQIIVGPAAVEMAGVLILPRLEDFNKINKSIIEDLYGEVTINHRDFTRLSKELMHYK